MEFSSPVVSISQDLDVPLYLSGFFHCYLSYCRVQLGQLLAQEGCNQAVLHHGPGVQTSNMEVWLGNTSLPTCILLFSSVETKIQEQEYLKINLEVSCVESEITP